MIKVTSITPKNQSLVNKAVNWLNKYDAYNAQRDLISDSLEGDESDSKEWRQINKKCEVSFDKYLDYLCDLPKREQDNIEEITTQEWETECEHQQEVDLGIHDDYLDRSGY